MPPYTRAADVIREATELQKEWQVRNDRFREMYKVLLLTDELKQKDMESFIGNDPRTFYNMSLHLLTPDVIPHKLALTDGRAGEIQATNVNRFLDRQWNRLNRLSRRRGRQSWLRSLAGYVLATGWYSVLAMALEDELIAEVWNPAEVFPDFGDEDLTRCAHRYKLSAAAARRKLKIKGWKYTGMVNQPLHVIDYWYTEEDVVRNVIVMGSQIVKPDTDTPFGNIPILVSPVGGLPDRGVIMDDESWKAHVGESILDTNSEVYKNYNKQMTFLQQLLRDVAQQRWVEYTNSEGILDEDSIFKRGAIFRASPEDRVGPLEVQPVPVEIQTQLFNIQNMIQRGGLPWALFGNVQQEIASFLMSQITAAAHQILKPYKDAVNAVLEDVDSSWLKHMRDKNLHPYGFSLPPGLLEDPEGDLDVDVGLEISVPGDLIQRMSVARMGNPDFRISQGTLIDLLFPEIPDAMVEEARVNAGIAMRHPVSITISTINAWRAEAEKLREGGDSAGADMFERAAAMMEQQLGAAGGGQPPQPTPMARTTPAGEPVPRELIPPEGM